MTSTLDTSNRNPLDESVRSVAQEGVKQKDLHEAYVTLLDGRKLSVQVHKNADGEVLFNLVTNAIGLIEKDYFALAFYDNNVRKWLYTKKKISKQIKELPWEFSLEVKFYVPDPRQLNEDFTRHLFTLQLRIDLYEARLPAVILNQAKLGSLIAQAELGDYKPDCQYYEALKGLNIVRTMSPELAEKIIQFYKEQKGKTPPEAELAFLLECRENSMYGMAVFDATERNKPVRIGINASGISIFNDQLRRYIIIWQSMHQLEFQRKTFTIRLKPGEKEGKNSLSYKLDSEGAAKRCWKTAVEHHTFFRLVQPDDKNRRLFGSGTFRHEGRTLFQTQMASQMFDGTQVTGPHIAPSHLITQSGENITSHTEFSSAPFQKQADENTQPEFMATSGHHASKSPREAFSPQSTNGTTSEIGKKSSKSPAKEELKRKLSSSSSDEEVEIEERHKIQSSTTAPHKVLTKEHDSSSKRSKRTTDNMFKTITNYANELKSEGPYTPANDKHGQVIRHEKVDQVYRITGAGQIPHFDPTDPETNPPRTTLQSWHEKTVGPETVTEEVDEHGNLIRKTIKTEQVKHTVQKQSYQTYTVPQSPSDLKQTLDSIQSISSSIPTSLPSGQTHVLVYGRDGELREPLQNEQFDENQSVSTKVVTTGNRTIETITYKNVKDGVVHTNVEHRVTITGPEIDQDAELRRAIAEATGLNPKYEVQRIEIKEERLQ
ncbi:Moesin/ezrin/radixin-like protein 1 [Aphelenchoides bicaudatus]|nr:Moesin/ezrin/radixin-like protein 1 [Aphelenchoides bicaudatus]